MDGAAPLSTALSESRLLTAKPLTQEGLAKVMLSHERKPLAAEGACCSAGSKCRQMGVVLPVGKAVGHAAGRHPNRCSPPAAFACWHQRNNADTCARLCQRPPRL